MLQERKEGEAQIGPSHRTSTSSRAGTPSNSVSYQFRSPPSDPRQLPGDTRVGHSLWDRISFPTEPLSTLTVPHRPSTDPSPPALKLYPSSSLPAPRFKFPPSCISPEPETWEAFWTPLCLSQHQQSSVTKSCGLCSSEVLVHSSPFIPSNECSPGSCSRHLLLGF